MTMAQRVVLVAVTLCVAEVSGQVGQREPRIGYLVPGGGQQGTVSRILVGGQSLRGAKDVYVSGQGVHASVVHYYRPLRNLEPEQREELARRMRAAIAKRWAELAEQGRVDPTPPWRELGGRLPGRAKAAKKDDSSEEEVVKLPDHPLLDNLEDKSLRELLHVRRELLNLRKRQPNAQIAESVLVEVAIDADAAPGDRELRLGTRTGLTNPMVFQVGTLPECREQEPNEPNTYGFLPEEPPAALPILVNGQILPGDIDRFRFRAQSGQQLVIEAHARRLIPFLADAVPGWFQATLALYDAEGNQVAFADDYRFDPDPILFYEIPKAGEYELEIRDSIYRGREDFVYRLSVAERPFITSMFPLGSNTGTSRYAAIDGWNLATKRLLLDAEPDDDGVRQKAFGRGKRTSNPVTYAVDELQARTETEDNNTAADAQRITLPQILNGRIAQPGDVDTFQFKAKAGDEIVAEVVARRLNSPLDSLLRLNDSTGNVLAWNDDCEHKDGFLHTDMGLITHHADSYLRAKLPADGSYYVQLTDTQGHGGAAYGYRLRVGPPQPDFALRVTPSSINVPAGRAAPICVYVLRKDEFAGEIELALVDAPRGFTLDGARVPAGKDRIRLTLTAPQTRLSAPVSLKLVGRARIGGKVLTRPAMPAENMMQAFLYRHLTPSQELMVAVLGRNGQPVELDGDDPVRIPAGGTAQVRIKAARSSGLQKIELELKDPPAGISLQNVTAIPGGLTFQLLADGALVPVGFADNLIVEAFTEVAREDKDQKKAKQVRRVSLGVLPAIPFEIVRK
ncbi:MAG: PPC domain-containing protein [Planctomycetes bacterium]|nr:PPC domain-containing protein [Planctomycetota bacterium]